MRRAWELGGLLDWAAGKAAAAGFASVTVACEPDSMLITHAATMGRP